MAFDLNKCVNFISVTTTKKISEAFGAWLRDDSITRIQWIALYFIRTGKDLSQRDLANRMGINDSSVMRLIDRLERDGLVIRERHKEDRRITLIALTEEGIKVIDALMPLGEAFNVQLTKGISPEDLKTYQRVQMQMYENIMTDERSR